MIDPELLARLGLRPHWQAEIFNFGRACGVAIALVDVAGRHHLRTAVQFDASKPDDLAVAVEALEIKANEWLRGRT